jgi:glucose dehydrogenase
MKQTARFIAVVLVCLALTITAFPAAAQTPPTTPDKLDWPYYGNDPGNMRYVNLDQINPGNVAQLQPAWIFHTGVSNERTSFESQPIVVDGMLYVSSPHSHVFALDAATGALKWTYNPQMPSLWEMAICCGQTNRGVAVGGGKVFVGQLDANLTALDAATGQVVWKTAVDQMGKSLDRDDGPAIFRRQGAHRRLGRRVRGARPHLGLRRRHRPHALALLHRARPR